MKPDLNYLSRLRASWLLVGAIVLGYVVGIITSGFGYCANIQSFLGGQACPPVLDFLVQQNSMVVYNGAFWQLFTSIFVTNSGIDVLLNALAVIILDLFITSYINRTRYFAIFFASALFGNILTLIQGPFYSSAGASGGIFGLFAATFSFTWSEQRRIDKTTITVFVVLFLASSLPLFGNLDVNWVAHVGGSIAGLVAGPVLYYSLRRELSEYSLEASRSKYASVVSALIALLIAGSVAQFLFFIVG